MSGRPTMKTKRDGSERPGRHTLLKVEKFVCCGVCKQKGNNKTTCPQVERTPKTNGRKLESVRQTQESVNMERGGEDVAMGDADREMLKWMMLNMVNKQEVHFGKVEQPRMRKKYERIVKLKLGKKIEGEGNNTSKPMNLE